MILVIGAGVAGLSSALAAVARGAEVELVTPGRLRSGVRAGGARGSVDALAGGNTAMAQGGIAAAVGTGDSVAGHLADTLAAGAGLVDAAAAEAITSDGARIVRELLEAGLPVDRGPDGAPLLGLEGAHGVPRILHAGGDRTGAALHAFLAERALSASASGALSITELTRAEALLVENGIVVGATLRDAGAGSRGTKTDRRVDAVVLATGGYAGLFPRTTNHPGATGAGILLAARAGALLADLEFVQFHPTALPSGELVSEAVRGAGAVLLDGAGDRFMLGRHPLAELAPRDVVSREIHRVLSEQSAAGAAHANTVWLDASGIEREGGSGYLARMFPGIDAAVAAHGYDWARQPIPVAPAAHYTMGGVASDLDGRSSVPGLCVAGEVASTGVHGANRLASNSLLEGLVFGERAGRTAAAFAGTVCAAGTAGTKASGDERVGDSTNTSGGWQPRGGLADLASDAVTVDVRGAALRRHPESAAPDESTVSAAITAALGIVRDELGLRAAAEVFADAAGDARADADLSDRAELAALVCAAALARRESRGAHQRADAPATDPAQARRRAIRVALASTLESGASPAPGERVAAA